MNNTYFLKLESASDKDSADLNEVIEHLAYNDKGLIPVITQDADTKNVLMCAWMNDLALRSTLITNKVTYWSRSRQALWVKGETSGNTQELVSMAFDCDGDTILCQVKQSGPACHTGRPNCFYLEVDKAKAQVVVKGNAP